MSLALRILALAAAAYLVLLAALWAFQDRLIYLPDRTPVAEFSSDLSAYSHISTHDGEQLQVWRAFAQTDCPTILHLHGNGGHIGRAAPHYSAMAAQTGAGLLAVSWRGYVGSTGAPSEAGLVIDALSAFDHLVDEGVAPADIIIHGFSLGSYPAIEVAIARKAAFLVLEAPYVSVLALAEAQIPFAPVSWLLRDHYRSDLRISEVDEFILMGHGAEDRVVAPVQSERLLAHAPASAQRVVFAGAGHNDLLTKGFFKTSIVPAITARFPDCAPAQSEPDPSAV
ncbi:MAG: alpha/beta hydrolase [Pseudomonadota bacterium]